MLICQVKRSEFDLPVNISLSFKSEANFRVVPTALD